jgi:hypothetical protein
LDIRERSGGRFIMQDQADLGIQHEGANIGIAGSDDGHAAIDRYVLRVQQPVAVEVEAYARLEQFAIIGSLGKVHEPLVHDTRNDEVDRDAACDRVLERGQQGFVWDQIGRDNGDILLLSTPG